MIKFDLDPFRKHCLLNGLDNIGLTLEKGKAIVVRDVARRAAVALEPLPRAARNGRKKMAKAIHMMVRVRTKRAR